MSTISNERITFPLRDPEKYGHSEKCKTRRSLPCDCWKGPQPGVRPRELKASIEEEGKAYGWLLNAQELVVDVDTRHDGKSSFALLLQDFPDFPWNTFCVNTGSEEGRHYYLTLPYSTRIKTHLKAYPGIDFKSHGHYVMKPGSIRGDNGNEATVVTEGELLECPLGLLAKIEMKHLVQPVRSVAEEEPLWLLEMALNHLKPTDYANYHDWLLIGRSLFSGSKGKTEGLELWYHWSMQDERYDNIPMSDLKAKWVSFYNTEEVTAKTLFYFAAKEGFDLNALLAKAFQPLAIEGEVEGALCDKTTLYDWVYITNLGKFINRYHGDFLSYSELNLELSYALGKQSLKILMNEGGLERAYKICYQPAKPSFIQEKVSPYRSFNLWRPTQLIAEKGDVSLFLQFMDYLFDEDAQFFLKWMAMLAQNKRPRYMCILYSKENQIGKSSMVGEILRQVCGPHNTCQINKKVLDVSFNGYLKGKQCVIIEELFSSSKKLEVYNAFKEMITDKYIMINEKKVKLGNIENFAAFLAFTNYMDALYLKDRDTRVLVLGCEKKPLPKEDYKTLAYELFERPFPALINHIYYYLLHMDIEDAVFGDAPNTHFKARMALHSRSLEEEVWEDIILENAHLNYSDYFICPLITAKNIERAFDIKLKLNNFKVLIEKHRYRKERIQIDRARYMVYISPLLFEKDFKEFVKAHWREANSQNVYFKMRPVL